MKAYPLWLVIAQTDCLFPIGGGAQVPFGLADKRGSRLIGVSGADASARTQEATITIQFGSARRNGPWH